MTSDTQTQTPADYNSLDAFFLLEEALMERGYNKSDLNQNILHPTTPKASITLSLFARLTAEFKVDGSGFFKFDDYSSLISAEYSFDGSYQDLQEALDLALEAGCELP